jgi:hypothetical protein
MYVNPDTPSMSGLKRITENLHECEETISLYALDNFVLSKILTALIS